MVWSDYTWIFVCSIFLALFVAWGIGMYTSSAPLPPP
jgi:hypothetical protein